jgi:hypothetical protein
MGTKAEVKEALSVGMSAAILSSKERVVSQRALASLTIDSSVPVKVGGACGGSLYLSGAIVAVTRGRLVTDDRRKEGVVTADEGRKRIWFRYVERRVTARGAARLNVIARRRTRREVRRRRRGWELLDGTVDVARVAVVRFVQ